MFILVRRVDDRQPFHDVEGQGTPRPTRPSGPVISVLEAKVLRDIRTHVARWSVSWWASPPRDIVGRITLRGPVPGSGSAGAVERSARIAMTVRRAATASSNVTNSIPVGGDADREGHGGIDAVDVAMPATIPDDHPAEPALFLRGPPPSMR